ncbi:MAG: hypothetical protein ABI824_05250 [Acidobacteriota bacterium]
MTLDILKTLASHIGPCITIALPDYHPGATEGSRRALLHNLLKSARQRLSSDKSPDLEALLAPLQTSANDAELDAGGKGWAIFGGRDLVERYRAPIRESKLTIGSHFLIAPFLGEVTLATEAFALSLNAKKLELFKCEGTGSSEMTCWKIPLPDGVPESQHSRHHVEGSENRHASGNSTGNQHAVQFGSGADYDNKDQHDYFELVDRGLKSLLNGRPLMLMGVQEEVAAYRRVASNGATFLAASHHGNAQALTPAQISVEVSQALAADLVHRGDGVWAELRELRDRHRVATTVEDVLQAAREGRVHKLCVRADTQLLGAPDSTTNAASEDLVNASLVETLRASGEVYVLPQDRMSAAQPLAAILRY